MVVGDGGALQVVDHGVLNRVLNRVVAGLSGRQLVGVDRGLRGDAAPAPVVVPRGDHASDSRSMPVTPANACLAGVGEEILTQVHVLAVDPVIYHPHRDALAHVGKPDLFDVDVLSRATDLTEIVEVPLALVQRIDRAVRCGGRRFPKSLALVEEGLVIFRNGELQRIPLLPRSIGSDAEVVRPGEQVARRGEFDLPVGVSDRRLIVQRRTYVGTWT